VFTQMHDLHQTHGKIHKCKITSVLVVCACVRLRVCVCACVHIFACACSMFQYGLDETFPQCPETMKMADFSILTCLHPYERVFLKAPREANKKKQEKRKRIEISPPYTCIHEVQFNPFCLCGYIDVKEFT